MAFKTSDFKKTTRKAGEGRQIYPHQIRDERHTAAIGYAIAYYERMVGRRRAEFEADALLEFFGDPRLARGLVACLGRTYAWREPTFADVFGEETARALWRAGLATPAALRRRLYGLANGRYGGVILPHERAGALEFLCRQINDETGDRETGRQGDRETGRQGDRRQETGDGSQTAPGAGADAGDTLAPPPTSHLSPPTSHLITPDCFERALTLDAEENRVLVKVGPTPPPEQIVAAYNFHSLETALCHGEAVQLRLRGPIWTILRSAHNLARRYRLRYRLGPLPRTLFDDRLDLTLQGGRDALGRWTRAGRRLARALVRLLAAHSDSAVDGEAVVHIGGQTLALKLDERALRVLGAGAGEPAGEEEAWEEERLECFRRAWGRTLVGGRTAGWRLRRDPEPLIGSGAVVVPDFALQRGHQRVALCLAASRAAAESLVRDIAGLGQRPALVLLVPEEVALGLARCPVPLASFAEQPAEAIAGLVRTLERLHPRAGAAATLTPWQRLERLVAEEGFVGEREVAELLGCPAHEAVQLVQRWGGRELHALPGLGVCAPEALEEIRELIEEEGLRERAA